MQFDNRPPINLEDAEQVASAERDGGSYHGVGFDVYRIYKGKKFHLIHCFNSGCDYGSGTHTISTHLGHWESVADLAEFLKTRTEHCYHVNDDNTGVVDSARFPWWASELLESLAVAEEA